MPLDVEKATSAPPVRTEVAWDARDVRLHHLALGAGVPETDPRELRYVFEGHERYDKGRAAVIVQESTLLGEDGAPLLTERNQIFVHGEGGFGGDRGPSDRLPAPDRAPDLLLEIPTLRRQALLYRLTGDGNPLHADPATARRAGYDRPVLHGLCTFGIAVKAVTDRLLDAEASAVAACRTRFAGVFHPGETLRLRVWDTADGYRLTATAAERDDAPVLTDALITPR